VKGAAMVVLLALVTGTSSCDFKSALDRYCAHNPQCAADAGIKDANASDGALVNNDSPPDQMADTAQAMSIPPPVNCGTSTRCMYPNQICHPFGQVCLTLCNSSEDCPPYLDTCVEIRDPFGKILTPKVCTCSSAEACNNYSDGFACNPIDGLCEPLCAINQNCAMFQPPRTCDKVYGLCQKGMRPCSGNSDCFLSGLPRCDPITQRCMSCIDDSDCSSRPDGLLRCGPDGSCLSP